MVFNGFLGGFLALFFMAQSWGCFAEEKEGAPMTSLRRRGYFEGVSIEKAPFQGQASEEFSFNDVFGRSPQESICLSILTEMADKEVKVVFSKKKKKKRGKRMGRVRLW